jgi:DNA-binding transcriptional regulator LsrR (DeoR family)
VIGPEASKDDVNDSQVSDEIAKLKYKEPQSTKIVQLEQELVRAEAQSLVAEAQLSNIVRALQVMLPHVR